MVSKKHALISLAVLALSASSAFAQGKGPVVGVIAGYHPDGTVTVELTGYIEATALTNLKVSK